MENQEAKWIWYPGDLEKFHALKQNFSRIERGCSWPAFWKSDGFRQRVTYRRTYHLNKPTSFTVYGAPGAKGYVDVGGNKHPFRQEISLIPGDVRIAVHAASIACVPAVYIQGDTVFSNDQWMVEDYASPPVPASGNRYFTSPEQDPAIWPLMEKRFEPIRKEEINGGTLFTFETELTAELEVHLHADHKTEPLVYLGESKAEALDTENCYYFCQPDPITHRCPRQALRYAFLPQVLPDDVNACAFHQYVDVPMRASFVSDDEKINRIFSVAMHTFSLCCDVFFLDGVKRDKWIWSGDAYQSLFVNRYLSGDRDIEQRTLIALRGNDPVTTHINTILDYSLLWILALDAHFDVYHDEAFQAQMWPQIKSMMDFIMQQRDENGFVIGRKQDWVFLDWADFDRDGPLCGEQMLLAAAYRVMATFSTGEEKTMYEKELSCLMNAIERYFWDPKQCAYVDSFTSGKQHITRHANILAIVFDLVSEERKRTIAGKVLFNDAIPAITTPYFRFFELEALCQLGYLKEVLTQMKAYWGGMLNMGAVTFWEEFNPDLPLEKQYAMYGDPFGKSLCHAWAASPVYLLARYFVGLKPDRNQACGYTVTPAEGFFKTLDCTLALGDQEIKIKIRNGKLLSVQQS